MKKAVVALVVAGVLVAITLAVVRRPREPVYDGETLSYWMEHYHRASAGSLMLVNPSAREAVRTAGTNALPYLIQWMKRPARGSGDVNCPSWALHGFEVLGPEAKPAIPELVDLLGKCGNYPDLALAAIGPDAVPAITNVLATNRNFRAHFAACGALSCMGANAESAVPCLVGCLKRPYPGVAARALAAVGHNRPGEIIPALVEALERSGGYEAVEMADALGSFGPAAADAVPALLAASTNRLADVRTHAAAALQRIAPGTPDALGPLIRNLYTGTIGERQQVLWTLEQLGTNGAAAWPALVERGLHDPVPHVRSLAIQCISSVGEVNEVAIAGLSENATNANSSVASKAVQALARFAGRSKAAFVALLQARERSPLREVRDQADTLLVLAAGEDSTLLVECMRHPDPLLRRCAVRIPGHANRIIPEAVPLLIRALHDDDPQVRIAATNSLILVDFRAAKREGVKLPPPYSYAE
jgi:HEAT repeat protein